MRIEWSGETAMTVQKALNEIAQALADCTGSARAILPELENLNAGKKMEEITQAFAETLQKMRRSEEKASGLCDGMRRMTALFEDAEGQILNAVRRIDGNRSAADVFESAAPISGHAPIPPRIQNCAHRFPKARNMVSPFNSPALALSWILEINSPAAKSTHQRPGDV